MRPAAGFQQDGALLVTLVQQRIGRPARDERSFTAFALQRMFVDGQKWTL
jgi:hypothetical protein